MKSLLFLIVSLLFGGPSALASSEIIHSDQNEFRAYKDQVGDRKILMVYQENKEAKIWDLKTKLFIENKNWRYRSHGHI